MNLIYKMPFWFQLLFPFVLWKKSTFEKKIYITFDDGPIPEITPWILEQLNIYNAKATFFVVGDNVLKHQNIFLEVLKNGHSIGNHTFNHLNGWKYQSKKYINNVLECENEIFRNIGFKTNLFRPPYGKMTPYQLYLVKKMNYNIVFWDVLSGDFNPKISKEQVLDNVINNIKPGSIIVFHDNIKAINHLKYVLPKTLEYLKNNHFICEKL